MANSYTLKHDSSGFLVGEHILDVTQDISSNMAMMVDLMDQANQKLERLARTQALFGVDKSAPKARIVGESLPAPKQAREIQNPSIPPNLRILEPAREPVERAHDASRSTVAANDDTRSDKSKSEQSKNDKKNKVEQGLVSKMLKKGGSAVAEGHRGIDPTVEALHDVGFFKASKAIGGGALSASKWAYSKLRGKAKVEASDKEHPAEPSLLGSIFGADTKGGIPGAQLKHNRLVEKYLKSIDKKVGGGSATSTSGGLIDSLTKGAGGLLSTLSKVGLVGAAAEAGYKVGGVIEKRMEKSKTGQNILDGIGGLGAHVMAALGDTDAQDAIGQRNKADNKERYKNRKENKSALSSDGVFRFAQKIGLEGLIKSGGGGSENAVALLEHFEGYQKKAKWDVNHYRAGYGSDTITDENGKVKSVQKGDSVSRTDAERDLKRRSAIFMAATRKQVGASTWDGFSPEEQGALTSIAYNYGSLPKVVLKAIKTGDTAKIADAVRSLKNQNNGINAKRRGEEADLIQNSIQSVSAKPSIDARTATKTIGLKPPILPPAPKLPTIPTIPPMLKQVNTPTPSTTNVIQTNDSISQNLADRNLAHAVTGGIGMDMFSN